jgi:hypothetical protein
VLTNLVIVAAAVGVTYLGGLVLSTAFGIGR